MFTCFVALVDFPTSDLDDANMDEPFQEASADHRIIEIISRGHAVCHWYASNYDPASVATSSPLTGVAATLAFGVLRQTIQPETLLIWLSLVLRRKLVGKLISHLMPAHNLSEPLAFPS